MKRELTWLGKDPRAPQHYRSAVSLHSHTNRSKEGLTFIAKYANRNPILKFALATQVREAMKQGAIAIDFEKAYWTPPLPPLTAFQLERDQIEKDLRLEAMVSLTDHDTIEAPLLLRVVPEANAAPVSVEWSVPYGRTMLHMGVHNLPADGAEALTAHFAEYTQNPQAGLLRDLLATLHENPDVLVVLNHPLWDLDGIGKEVHIRELHDFAAKLGMFVHAFEISGVRSWRENQEVLELAERWNQPVVGGGDRHGAEPNAILNLTDARSFAEYVHEVRRNKLSHVLIMPQYNQSFALRVFQSILDTIRTYPELPRGTRRWDERVFHPGRARTCGMQPLAELWDAPPLWLEVFFRTLWLLEYQPVRAAVGMLLARPDRDVQSAARKAQEVGSQWSSYASRSSRTPTPKSTVWRTPAANLRRSRENADSPS